MQTRFNFVGTLSLPKADSKKPFIKEMSKNNRKMLSMNFGIKESDHNMAFVEAFDGTQDVIKTMNTDNEKIEVSWSDRFDEDVVKSVANYKKFVVDLGDENGRKEFIATYDAIEYLKDKLPSYKGKLCVTGQMNKQFYQDKWYDKFVINGVYAVDEERKNRLGLTVELTYNKDCVDKSDWKSDKKIYIDGYVQQYINKDEGTKYVPQRVVFNAQKYKDDNEKHQALLDYKMKYIDISDKKMQKLMWECVLVNGAETVEFDESQLTKNQKEQLALGIRKIEDFRPSGSIFGDRISEVRLFEPILKGDYDDGLVDTGMSVKEFEEEIYIPAQDEKLDDVVKKAESKSKKTEDIMNPPEEDDDDDDDLF